MYQGLDLIDLPFIDVSKHFEPAADFIDSALKEGGGLQSTAIGGSYKRGAHHLVGSKGRDRAGWILRAGTMPGGFSWQCTMPTAGPKGMEQRLACPTGRVQRLMGLKGEEQLLVGHKGWEQRQRCYVLRAENSESYVQRAGNI